MPTTLHLVRHAQGIHNLGPQNHHFVDPDLTDLGHEQCRILHSQFPHHSKITFILASPLRRTIYTALESFHPLDPTSPVAVSGNTKIITNPLIQEVSTNPCDFGSSPAKLAEEFRDKVDLSRVGEDWCDKSKGSKWAPTMDKLQARAREARVWVREIAGGADTAEHIVVVTHGGILHFITEDYDGLGHTYGTGWNNTECRSYHFEDLTGQDPDAHLKETATSWRKRRGSEIPLTESEQMELRSVVRGVLKNEFGEFHEDEEAIAN